MNIINKAMVFAATKHNGQTRRDKSPYIWHPMEVARMLRGAGYDEICQVAGLLHDTIEDTGTTYEEIEAEFGSEVAKVVDRLTKKANIPEEDYIAAILNDERAKAVKNCDRLHNLWECIHQGTPGTMRTPQQQKFAEKYVKESRKLFYGRFSLAMDKAIAKAEDELSDPLIRDVLWYETKDISLYESKTVDKI